MDPSPIGLDEWREIGRLLTQLWLVVMFIVLFATNMLLGHNFIPSLHASQHVPEIAQKSRPLFYGLAVVCFGVAIFFLSRVVDDAGVLRNFWSDYWI